MRRKFLAIVLTALALTSLGSAAGAAEEQRDYVCIRSRLLLGDPVCIHYSPSQD